MVDTGGGYTVGIDLPTALRRPADPPLG